MEIIKNLKLSQLIIIVIIIVMFILVARIPGNIMNALKKYDEKEKENEKEENNKKIRDKSPSVLIIWRR